MPHRTPSKCLLSGNLTSRWSDWSPPSLPPIQIWSWTMLVSTYFFLRSQIHFHDLTAFRFFSPFSFSNSYTHNPDCHIQEIAKYHGGGCTYKAVWGVMTTCKSNGDMLREAFDSGVDPIGIVMKDGSSAKATGRTKSGSTCDFSFSPIFTWQHQSPFLAALPRISVETHIEIARAYGADCTYHSVENQFRKYKTIAKSIRNAMVAGVDPYTIPIGEKNGTQSQYYSLTHYYLYTSPCINFL